MFGFVLLCFVLLCLPYRYKHYQDHWKLNENMSTGITTNSEQSNYCTWASLQMLESVNLPLEISEESWIVDFPLPEQTRHQMVGIPLEEEWKKNHKKKKQNKKCEKPQNKKSNNKKKAKKSKKCEEKEERETKEEDETTEEEDINSNPKKKIKLNDGNSFNVKDDEMSNDKFQNLILQTNKKRSLGSTYHHIQPINPTLHAPNSYMPLNNYIDPTITCHSTIPDNTCIPPEIPSYQQPSQLKHIH